VDIAYTKLQSTKVALCLLLGFLAVMRSVASITTGTTTLSTVFAGFFVSLVSVRIVERSVVADPDLGFVLTFVGAGVVSDCH
jgi:hypothetical protein